MADSIENWHVDHGCKQVKMEPVQRKGNFNIVSETWTKVSLLIWWKKIYKISCRFYLNEQITNIPCTLYSKLFTGLIQIHIFTAVIYSKALLDCTQSAITKRYLSTRPNKPPASCWIKIKKNFFKNLIFSPVEL